jgi:hypothetical protein
LQRTNRELWWAFLACLAISLGYLFITLTLKEVPAASGLIGHSIGILGFLLMLMTETLYTLRKRSRTARWGSMSTWLDFHIFTGIVGPYMVLLHSSWKFQGLAGMVMAMTVVMVVSGFIGRYIFTAIPRTVDGVELEANQIERQAYALEADLQNRLKEHPQAARSLAPLLISGGSGGSGELAFASRPLPWNQRLRLSWELTRMRATPQVRAQIKEIDQLARRRAQLSRQVASLSRARRWMALWHAVHIPLGLALFTAAFIHIAAAIYFATLLR